MPMPESQGKSLEEVLNAARFMACLDVAYSKITNAHLKVLVEYIGRLETENKILITSLNNLAKTCRDRDKEIAELTKGKGPFD